MEEKNIMNGLFAAVLGGFLDFLQPLNWFMLLGLVLIIADLRFGIAAARARGEAIRSSRAIRRLLNKIVDYLCWIFLAGAMGRAYGIPFDVPLLPSLVLFVIYGCEINSCYANYFEAHGKRLKVNIFKLFQDKTKLIEVEDIQDEVK